MALSKTSNEQIPIRSSLCKIRENSFIAFVNNSMLIQTFCRQKDNIGLTDRANYWNYRGYGKLIRTGTVGKQC